MMATAPKGVLRHHGKEYREMKITIVGEGKVGFSLAQRLLSEGHDVTAIDQDADVLSAAVEELDILTVQGNGAALETLKEANVADSDLLIATTNADETNLLCCLTAKKLGCKQTIARVRDPQYVRQALFLKEELGLSLAVNPELAAAQEIYRVLQYPSFLKRESFDKGRVELVELQIDKDSKLKNKKLSEIAPVLGSRVLICAAERDGEVTIPNGSFVLQEGDRITVTAARTEMATIVKKMGLEIHKIRSVMIVGCGRIAAYLAEELQKNGVSIKLVDKKKTTCEAFAIQFPSALVICGDALKHGFLESERVEQTDAVITLTGADEENLMISMFCSHLGVPKTVTKIDRQEYARLFDDRGIGSVVCPKELTANEIIRYVRAMSQSGEGSVRALHRIVGGKAEALEFVVSTSAPYTDVPLSQLKLKPNVLIACISRNNRVIVPKGDDKMLVGDTLIVVTTADRALCDLKDIFEKDTAKSS